MIPASILQSPAKITGQLENFAARLGAGKAQMVKLVPFPGCTDDCTLNLNAQTKTYGGTALAGWRIQTWPRILFVATPHQIWHSPKDELIDITPADKVAQTLFVADPNASGAPLFHLLKADRDLAHWLSDQRPESFIPIYNRLSQGQDPCWCGSGRQWRKCHKMG